MSIQEFRSKSSAEKSPLFNALRKIERIDHPGRLTSGNESGFTDWNPWPSAESKG